MFELIYENKLVLAIIVLLSMVGCILYSMKDKLFKTKQVMFDPDATWSNVSGDADGRRRRWGIF